MPASKKKPPSERAETKRPAPQAAGRDVGKPLFAVLGLCVLGLVDMVYLTRLHWSVRSIPGYSSFCAISAEVDCDAVAASPFSMLLGVPVSFWGVLAYLALIVTAVWALRSLGSKAHPGLGLGFLAAAAVGSILASAALGYVSAVHIESFCILCAVGYVINLGIAAGVGVALYMLRLGPLTALRLDLGFMFKRPGLTASIGGAGALVAAATILLYPTPTLKAGQPDPGGGGAGVTPTAHVASGGSGPAPVFEQSPFLGDRNALVTIVEFTDYECAFCRRSHAQMKTLLAPYEGRYRIMHRHFPLDQACNPSIPRPFNQYSCAASRYAICAQQQGKFWELNGLLFSSQVPLVEEELRRLADRVGCDLTALDACLSSELPDQHLARDVEDGMGLGVRGTPTFFINGQTVVGLPQPEVLERIFAAAGTRD